MTSSERREARYQRRKKKRQDKRIAFLKQFESIDDVFGTFALIQSAQKCQVGVRWKPGVQAYLANLVINSNKASRQILQGIWKTKGFHEFDIVERGKPRHIKSVIFEERCIQRSLCDNYITPILSHYLIYDNGATLANKGTDFALDRFTKHLRWFYKRHGRNGYIFFFDFSKYFENIDIEKLKSFVSKYIPDGLPRRMYFQFIDVFGDEGLGLGSQVSQISAVFFANALDHLIKDKLGIHCYARYMDDGYIIHHDLEELKQIVNIVVAKCAELGIIINKKKFQIIPLNKPFRFLKIRFFITDTGKVVRRLDKQIIKKEHKKLRKFKEYLLDDRITTTKIYNMFHSWLYSQKRGKNYHILKNMIAYYNNLFDDYVAVKPKNSRCSKQYHTINYIYKFTSVA